MVKKLLSVLKGEPAAVPPVWLVELVAEPPPQPLNRPPVRPTSRANRSVRMSSSPSAVLSLLQRSRGGESSSVCPPAGRD